jgi:nucleoside-diphosphate-sugar epimerase
VQAGQEVVIPADLDVAHSWTYTGDVARTLVAVARSERSWGSAWHTPQTSELSVREMANRFATVTGSPQPAVREMTPLELHTAMADPVMVELAEMAYLFYRENVLDWSRTAAEFDLSATPLDDVLRESANAA